MLRIFRNRRERHQYATSLHWTYSSPLILRTSTSEKYWMRRKIGLCQRHVDEPGIRRWRLNPLRTRKSQLGFRPSKTENSKKMSSVCGQAPLDVRCEGVKQPSVEYCDCLANVQLKLRSWYGRSYDGTNLIHHQLMKIAGRASFKKKGKKGRKQSPKS